MKNHFNLKSLLLSAALVSGAVCANAQQTETLYLSGKGLFDTKKWDFRCSGGQNSGKWKKIEVPSQWELQGFGDYTYGRFYVNKGEKASDEIGEYKTKFKLPASWNGKKVSIVFEGSMTDTEVKVNGKLAGAIHQGGFYQFEYDITNLLIAGNNLLEVKVSKESENKSINGAERRADWWLFGGIYRPVYLKAEPKSNIHRIAVDAKADGSMNVDLYAENVPSGATVKYELSSLKNPANIIATKEMKASAADVQTHSLSWGNVEKWECEHPNMYVLGITLQDANGKAIHKISQRVGFRTVEFRPADGLYVNDVKVVLKGVNRHSFHPEGGRTTNKALSIEDAKLIKQMNMNAVRSHYPPDNHFLDVCDSLGLFYLDELAGWHDAYDSKVGPKLVEEMLVRDVNHPCIIVWNNGNEGGWNYKLDGLFEQYDPQKRHVIHPWADFNQFDTHHYPAFLTGVGRFVNGYKVFMPTEFEHAMYDQGAGAGLEDFWDNYTSHPLFAGGFIWAFCDETVVRTDRNNELDSDGSNAPDGILGPYREKEGSFDAVRNVWAPIQFKKLYITPSFKGDFMVTNKYLYTNLDKCKLRYKILGISSPLKSGESKVLCEGQADFPSLEPNETRRMHIDFPANLFDGDLLEMTATDEHGEDVCTWTWPIHYAPDYFGRQNSSRKYDLKSAQKAEFVESADEVVLKANGVEARFNKADGQLKNVLADGKESSLKNGPTTVGLKMKFQSASVRNDGNDAVYVVKYLGGVDSIVWRMQPDGVLGLDAVMLNRANGGKGFDDAFMDTDVRNFGFNFSYDEQSVKGMKWMGRGPYRVWKNRIRGHNIGLWHKDYNNTITGETKKGKLEYPEFKGYHANIYWATLESDTTPMTVFSETDGVFFRVFTPQEPEGRAGGKNTMPSFPEGDISFLLDIPAIQSFKPVSQHGPKSQPGNIRIKQGDEGLKLKLWFKFK